MTLHYSNSNLLNFTKHRDGDRLRLLRAPVLEGVGEELRVPGLSAQEYQVLPRLLRPDAQVLHESRGRDHLRLLDLVRQNS